ncbi:hypothetical protein PENSPDRAFT_42884 [Peniophora sp. CONT]|nr:hypothetical protein PENSPDRAFT_42884 [Peniophora sp. CONT]
MRTLRLVLILSCQRHSLILPATSPSPSSLSPLVPIPSERGDRLKNRRPLQTSSPTSASKELYSLCCDTGVKELSETVQCDGCSLAYHPFPPSVTVAVIAIERFPNDKRALAL